MRIFYRVLVIMIAVCIPLVSIFGALNLVYRIPDIYVYEFNSKQIAAEVDLEITDDELGTFFSDYMKGKEENFDLFAEYRDREQAVFGTGEQINMANARTILNDTLYILGGAALLVLVSYAICIAKKRKQELRVAFKGGIIVFAVVQVGLYAAFFTDFSRNFFYHKLYINPFGADDVLPLMLTKHFAELSLYAITAVSLVITIAIASATWRLTKPRRMFW